MRPSPPSMLDWWPMRKLCNSKALMSASSTRRPWPRDRRRSRHLRLPELRHTVLAGQRHRLRPPLSHWISWRSRPSSIRCTRPPTCMACSASLPPSRSPPTSSSATPMTIPSPARLAMTLCSPQQATIRCTSAMAMTPCWLDLVTIRRRRAGLRPHVGRGGNDHLAGNNGSDVAGGQCRQRHR